MKKNDYIRYQFDNGLTLYYAKNNINKSTELEAYFDCGSRCDGEKPGLAHFCEHMFFTGTKTETKQEISKKYFDFIRVNAVTSMKNISFYGNIFTDELSDYLSFVAHLINDSTFSQKAVDEEKKVVIQEIVGNNNNYNRLSYLYFGNLKYDKQYYLDGVLGNEDSIKTITSEDVKKFVRKYFVANNCHLYIVSPLSFEQIKEIVSNNFAYKLRECKRFKELPYYNEEMIDQLKFKHIEKDIDKNYLNLAFKVPYGINDLNQKETLLLLCDLIDNFSDGLLKTLRLDLGLVYGVSVYSDINKDSSVMNFETTLSKENIKKTIDVIAEHIQKIKIEGFSEEQLNNQKRTKKFFIATRSKTTSGLVYDLKKYRKYNRFIYDEEIDKIGLSRSLKDVNKLIKDIFSNPKFVTMVYGNAKAEDVYSLEELKEKFQ